ncbi:MAG TPA: VPLPA-CTERM-specific exosortase XrtD, partial [Alphaproteobacteria bacterium]|nr:VPLPA-CTERM-specific exosortase XrtD [Alphaproteobacteria bacterium]
MNRKATWMRHEFFRSNAASAIFLAVSVIAVFWISSGSLLKLPYYWGREEYSHGWLIPLVAAFIGWHALCRDKPEPVPSWMGLPVLFFSLLLSALSVLAAFEALLNFSFIIALLGLALAFFGRAFTLSVAPALVFLFFAAPLPHIVYGNLSIQMQLVSSTLGTSVIRLFGFSVFQDGNVIDLGFMKLQVAEACNGLRYLFPLTSLAYLMVLLMDGRLWKKVAVFLSAVPITIFMNSLRIAMVGITVNLWGREMAEGVLHMFEGFVVFGLCLILLFGEAWLLLRVGEKGGFRDTFFTLPQGPVIASRVRITPPAIVGLLLCLLGFAFFQSGLVGNRLENTPSTPAFSTFPLRIGEWSGSRDSLSTDNLEILDLTDYWLANYTKEHSTDPVNLYIAWYASQRMRANIHIPLNCIIGGGWRLEDQRKFTVVLPEGILPVVRLTVIKDGETSIVYYWLDQRGRKMNDPFTAKWFLVSDSITMHRTDGALVRVSTPLEAGEKPEDGDERLRQFLQKAYPEVKKFVPQ